MTEHPHSLAFVYEGWNDFQRNLLDAVTPLSAEQLALPVAWDHWSLADLVRHIAADRVWWFHLWMGEGGDDIAALVGWDEQGLPPCSPAELIAALEVSWQLIQSALAHWTVADLSQVFEPPVRLSEAERSAFGPQTRQEILFHVLRHDLHHGGELAASMGAHHLLTIWSRAGIFA